MYKFLVAVLLGLFPVLITAQDFNYIQYDTKDGLAGSTVYDMCQDRDGFIWFGTANGLSRFDGTAFVNFTVSEGLPDNEVLKLFPDSRGRLWIGTFSKEVCYFYKGQIYNKRNTPWLSEIMLKNAALSFCEDEAGTVMVSDFKGIYEIKDENKVRSITDLPAFKDKAFRKVHAVTNYHTGGFFVLTPGTIYKFQHDSLVVFNHPQDNLDRYMILKESPDGRMVEAYSPETSLSQTGVGHTTTYVSTINGAWSVDTIQNKFDLHFLPGKKVSHTIKDTEGNLWFSTLGEGVFRLASLYMKNIVFPESLEVTDKEVLSLGKYGNDILCGLGFSKIAFINQNKVARVLNFESLTHSSSNNSSTNKLRTIKVFSNGTCLLGFDAFLVNMVTGKRMERNIVAVKSIDQLDSNHALVGAFNFAFKVSVNDLKIIDTLFNGRCTKVFCKGDKYYIGTLSGLYEATDKQKQVYLGDIHPSLARRITDIVADKNNLLWIATNDAGVVGYKNGKVEAVIRQEDGLSSNICKTLFLDDNYLWVGTNKGLNKVDLLNRDHPIIKYSASDGLPSDIINSLYINDSIIYVGSPKGLTYFNEALASNTSICRLKLLKIVVSGKTYPITSNYQLEYKDNNISFGFIAISYKSGGDIVYHYKLSGLDTAWKTTRETSLTYQTLPPGRFNLQLYAVNKFGVRSETEQIEFSIASPFWKTGWAYAILIFLLMVLTGLLVGIRSRYKQRQLMEKNKFQKQFAELEQQALQAQMNPHFIFNCLNSIQQYMLTNEREKANQYLTGFASLIRQTLYISSKKSIKISEEIAFLKEYLSMEKMRFGDSFTYEISVDDSVNVDFMEMPALLLQPYVENALRHGIRYKQDGGGKAVVSFTVEKNMLICRVTDNGVGRAKAALYKNNQHIEYQSKGMSLTEKRIDLINKVNLQKITIEINDLKDESDFASGTEVIVQIPV